MSRWRLGRRACAVLFLTVVCGLSTITTATAADRRTPAQASRPTLIDLSGVERFLEITAILEQDQEPTNEQWDRLFATPGYAVLLKREFSRDFFIQRFTLAFKPSRKADLEAQMKREVGYSAQFLPHYLRAKAERAEIERRVRELRAKEFTDEAVALARAWLPEIRTDATPLVAFVVFKDDARGFDPVVFDILYKRDRTEFVETVAHEFHHWYRNRIAPDLLRDRDTLWMLEQTQLEGIADLINVPTWMKRPPESLDASEKSYLAAHAKSGEILRGMDDLLSKMYDDPTQRRALGASLLALVPRSGHPTGYFMAQTIVAELGKKALVATVSNPFAFYRAYHDAARKRRDPATPVFSEKTMALLSELETRYAPDAGSRRGP